MTNKYTRNNILTTLAIAVVVLIASTQQSIIFSSLVPENDQNSRNLSLGTRRRSDATFVYGIFSMRSAKDERRREVIRSTYLQDPRFCPLKDLIAPDESTPSTCFIYYTFVVSGGDKNAPTEHRDDSTPLTLENTIEEKEKGDIVVLNIKENMNQGKSVTWFKYASSLVAQGHKIDYVGKMDSDTLPNTNRFVKWVERKLPPAPFNRRIYGGKSGAIWRQSTYYPFGEFYFMSTDLARYISVDLTPAKRDSLINYKIEDVEIGVLVNSNDRPNRLMNLNGINFWIHPLKDEARWFRAFNGNFVHGYYHKFIAVGHICSIFGFRKGQW